MKRSLKFAILVALAALLFALPVAAMGNGNVKGEVTAIDEAGGTFTILSNKGESILVNAPAGYDFSTIEVGDSVLVRGELVVATITATTIKVIGGGNGGEVESEGEGSLADNSAFCATDKQTKPHPMAVAIAATYGVSEADIIGYFCEGHSFGAVMLAFQTREAGFGDVSSNLAARAAGMGWGQIWKDAGLIGNGNAGASPPGLFHRPENPGNPND